MQHNHRNLLITIGEWWEQRNFQKRTALDRTNKVLGHSAWLPTPGNVVFTTLMLVTLLWAQNAGAISLGAPLAATTSTAGIAYQGRLADKNGSPLTQTVNMIFRLYAAASGGSPLWEEQWTGTNSVQVSDGLFNVMLGSLTPIPQTVITGNSNLFLGITVGTDSEMSPRVQLGSVPFATQALTVPDGSITTTKIADGAITPAKLSGSLGQVAQDNQPSPTYVTGTTAFQDKATVNLTTKGGPVLVLASFSHVAVGSQHSPMQIRIAVDDFEKKNSGNQYNVAWTNGALTWIETDLQPGAHTFKLQYAITNTADQAHIEHATLTVVELGL